MARMMSLIKSVECPTTDLIIIAVEKDSNLALNLKPYLMNAQSNRHMYVGVFSGHDMKFSMLLFDLEFALSVYYYIF